MERLKRLEEDLVPLIVNSNKYGSDLEFVKWENSEKSEGDVQFASTVAFVSAVFQSKTGVVKFPFVMKYEVANPTVRRWLVLEPQFYNEVFVYEHILPFLDANNVINDLFPLYYFGYCTSSSKPEDDVIVLEDLRPSGFRLSEALVTLDFDHCAHALRQIGRYHALSYNAKQNKTEEFYDKIKYLKECRCCEDKREDNNYIFPAVMKRAVQPLLKRNEHINIVNRFLEETKDAHSYLSQLLKPEEPLAVICHGDFCRNNILFRYGADNKPIDARLYDIATSRYASPAIDLSFFLFLNTTYETRKLYWDVFLKIYHDAMVETLPAVVMPSLEDVKQEMQKKAVYGFVICSFFLPCLLHDEPFIPDIVCTLSLEKQVEEISRHGGQKASDVMSEMFKELVDRRIIK